MVDKSVVEDFLKAIQPADKNTDHTYNATVTRVDKDGVVWVQVAGSDKETPTSSTSSEVKRGDAVNVQWRNNKLYVAGNYTNPSAGSVRVRAVEVAAQVANQAASNAVADAGVARQAAESAQSDAARAKSAADGASEYAARAFGNLSTVQSITETLTWITQHGTMTLTTDVALDPTHVYFVQDAGGDYVVGGVTYAVVTEPDVADIGTYYELSIDESLNNYVGTHLALTSEGLWLAPEAGGNKVLIATGAGSTYTIAGTHIVDPSENTVALFGANVIRMAVENSDAFSVYGDGASVSLKPKIPTTWEIEKGETKTIVIPQEYQNDVSLSGADGINITFKKSPETAVGSGWDFTYGTAVQRQGDASRLGTNYDGAFTFVCTNTSATTDYYAVISYKKTGRAPCVILGATDADQFGAYSVTEGRDSIASGNYSHAEAHSTASGDYSHSEGTGTTASGGRSHAEGANTNALAFAAHAEGWATTASGFAGSHAEGYDSTASGDSSHAQNTATIAQRKSQTAIGEYNIADTSGADETVRGDYSLIIGNGTADNARSNALTVDWSGRISCGDQIGNFKSIFDIFYPVGSYYETSLSSDIPSGATTPNATDLANLGVTWFNPKYAWGGTWVLETSGQVHVSAGTGYSISGALTNTSDGGNKDAIVPYHRHSVDSVSISSSGGHRHQGTRRPINTASGSGMMFVGAATSTTDAEKTYVTREDSNGSHTHSVPSHNTNYEPSTDNRTDANMPPYIVVNRWHRTA